MNIAFLRQDCRARVVLLLGLACVVPASGQNYPNIRFLPTAFGGQFREGKGTCVSGDGTFVGGSSWDEAGKQAYRWGGVSTVSLTLIGSLPSEFAGATVRALSYDGAIAVGSSSSYFGNEAFVSYSPGSMFDLGHLDERFTYRYASGISADGNVIVGSMENFNPPAYSAFRWTPDEGLIELPALPNVSDFRRGGANGVSADGHVIVGWVGGSDRLWTAARWVDGEVPQILGDIPGGHSESIATAASADGSVIVGTIRPLPAGSESQFFRWTEEGGIELLGTLPGGVSTSESALSVSADGNMIVGVASEELYPEKAVIWDRFNGLRPLESIVGFNSLFSLDKATGISADGRVVSGTATINTGFGHTVAWRAELWPPRCRREDIDNDRVVGLTDLATLLAHFGEISVFYQSGDLTLDGAVTLTDLAVMLSAFGTACD